MIYLVSFNFYGYDYLRVRFNCWSLTPLSPNSLPADNVGNL